MSARKFRVVIPSEGCWIIEFPNTDWFTEEWLREWSYYFYNLSDLKEVAENIVYALHSQGNYDFIEGYGPVSTENGSKVVSILDHSGKEIARAVVKLESYYDDIDIFVEEIE